MNAIALPKFPRPRGFRASDLVIEAEFCESPFGPTQRANNPAAVRGQAYERRAHRHLGELFPAQLSAPFYVPSRWIRFLTSDPRERRYRFAEPDGLLIDLDRRHIVILEMKLTHTQYAWWGLRRLYEPLIRKIFGRQWTYAVCEVCRYYDPSIAFPEPFTFVRSPTQLAVNGFGVMLLTPEAIGRETSLRAVPQPNFPCGLESL